MPSRACALAEMAMTPHRLAGHRRKEEKGTPAHLRRRWRGRSGSMTKDVAFFRPSGPWTLNGPFDYEDAPQRLFKIVTAEEDADATEPEVFEGPATNPSLRSP
ncbi:MAG: hypothetical protein ACE1Z6_08145 [Candidatus Methylomirabilales bacterium]